MKAIVEFLTGIVSDYAFPPTCHLCGSTLMESKEYLCPVCKAKLPRTGFHRTSDNAMEQRFFGLVPFERATGHFFYAHDSSMAVLMQDLKYRKFREMARWFGRLAGSELQPTGWLADISGVAYVPMHFFKQARRGYNPAEEIARGLASEAGLPLCHLLKSSRPRRTQTSKSLKERRENAGEIYRVREECGKPGSHILLVDDVCTTGATLTAAANAIVKDIPESRISIFSLAVTF